MAWYSGNNYEQYMIVNRMFGPYCAVYWALILLQLSCSRNCCGSTRMRTNVSAAVHHRHCVNIGMWLERFVIVVTSCTGIFCRRHGACITRPSGTGRCSSARSACSFPAFFVYSLPADDLDFRDADAVARSRGTKMTRRKRKRDSYRHLRSHGRVRWTGSIAGSGAPSVTEGYRRMDAYSSVSGGRTRGSHRVSTKPACLCWF